MAMPDRKSGYAGPTARGCNEAVRFESLAVLGEGGGVEGLVTGLHVEEPVIEEVEVVCSQSWHSLRTE
jgi:hypothetical protein